MTDVLDRPGDENRIPFHSCCCGQDDVSNCQIRGSRQRDGERGRGSAIILGINKFVSAAGDYDDVVLSLESYRQLDITGARVETAHG